MIHDSASSVRFAPSPRYWLLAPAGIGVALLFAWDMRRGLNAELLIVALLGLAAGLWALRQATTAVTITGETIAVRRLGGTVQVEFGQILDVGEAGRLFRIVSLLYYPRSADGRMDTDAVRTLALPALREQAAFLRFFAAGALPPASHSP